MAISFVVQGNVIFGGSNNTSSTKPTITHDLSSQIPNNLAKEFNLNPLPVPESLTISLDGLILRRSPDGIAGDYTYDANANLLTLLIADIEDDSVLLALYQEA